MSQKTQDMVEFVWTELGKQIVDNRRDLRLIAQRTERSETAGGHQSYTFATRPTANNSGGDEIWISDGRKVGEGAGAGTGVLCYWNPATSTWKLHRDDSNVAN